MNLELLWVVGLLATTVALFIHNRLRLDVIALLVIMAFSVSGTLTPTKPWPASAIPA